MHRPESVPASLNLALLQQLQELDAIWWRRFCKHQANPLYRCGVRRFRPSKRQWWLLCRPQSSWLLALAQKSFCSSTNQALHSCRARIGKHLTGGPKDPFPSKRGKMDLSASRQRRLGEHHGSFLLVLPIRRCESISTRVCGIFSQVVLNAEESIEHASQEIFGDAINQRAGGLYKVRIWVEKTYSIPFTFFAPLSDLKSPLRIRMRILRWVS